ncbi:hypothetical protein [Streptomyces sp. t99]|uniref:hypothetical protein n=1 Tax=Streptomyces sp. t99 TaxID=1828172 RepID=UPI000BFDA3A5|nr:hypothetical protein [Streptomyces sp. t99]
MAEENEWGLRPLGPSEVNRLRGLAAAVAADLARSGLVISGQQSQYQENSAGGLRIEVDEFDDAAGGIWLHWEVHPSLRKATSEALRGQRFDDPVIASVGRIHERMASTILCMLGALGYVAEPSDDDYRPFAIKVLSAST